MPSSSSPRSHAPVDPAALGGGVVPSAAAGRLRQSILPVRLPANWMSATLLGGGGAGLGRTLLHVLSLVVAGAPARWSLGIARGRPSASTPHTKTSHDPNRPLAAAGLLETGEPLLVLTPCTLVNAPPAWAPPPPPATAETPIGLPTTSGSQPVSAPSRDARASSLRRVIGVLQTSGLPGPAADTEVVEMAADDDGSAGTRHALDVTVRHGEPPADAVRRRVQRDVAAVAAAAADQLLARVRSVVTGQIGRAREPAQPSGRRQSAARWGCDLPFTAVKSPPANTRLPPGDMVRARTVEFAFGCHGATGAALLVPMAARRLRLMPLTVRRSCRRRRRGSC